MIMKNQRVVVLLYDDKVHSGMHEVVHTVDRKLSEHDFKKWWKHTCKVVRDMDLDCVDIFAVYTDAYGDTQNLTFKWEDQTFNVFSNR